MASVSTFLIPSPTPKSKPPILKPFTFNPLKPQLITLSPKTKQIKNLSVIRSLPNDLDIIPTTDQQDGVAIGLERETDIGRLSFEGAGFSSGSGGGEREVDEEGLSTVNRGINAAIVLAAGAFALSKLLTIDQEYWHGWTVYEIVRYAPQHNWSAYEAALKTNPVLAKMVISGVVYSIGDWIAQCVEGKPLFDFDRTRMFRSGLVGFTLHGSLSHYYYQFCEVLFPFHDWWVVPVKVVFDQTVWSAIWNSIYFTVLGFLRWESPVSIASELKATFVPMLTAGWKLWPFAHLITYGVVPVEQRLLWVDCVELIWVTILSTYSNEKSEARILESQEADSSSPSTAPSEE